MEIRIALPSKGWISDPAVNLLSKAGIGLKDAVNRRLFSETYDDQISVMFTRAADIPEFVADGAADLGLTGLDLIEEKEAHVKILEDLKFGRSKLVLAAPEDSDIKELSDVKDGSIAVKIVELSGSTEIAPFIGVSDLITDLTSTGTTLKMNHLQMVETILESSVHLIANPDSYQEKMEKIEEIRTGV